MASNGSAVDAAVAALRDQNKIFAHFTGDLVARGSRYLEGNVQSDSIDKMSAAIEEILSPTAGLASEVLTAEQIEALRTAYDDVLRPEFISLAENSDLKDIAHGFPGMKADFSRYMAGIVKSKNFHAQLGAAATKPVMIPGGWSGAGSTSGHAMVYGFKKVGNHLIFTVYNTGAGINFHEIKPGTFERYPYMGFRVESFFSLTPGEQNDKISKFIAELMKSQCTKMDKHNADRVYRELIPAVSQMGSKVDALDPKDLVIRDISTPGQRSGTCTMRVLMKMLCSSIDKETSQTVVFLIKLRAIRQQREKIFESLAFGLTAEHPEIRTAARLLEFSIKDLARRFNEFKTDDYSVIDEEKFRELSEELKGYLDELSPALTIHHVESTLLTEAEVAEKISSADVVVPADGTIPTNKASLAIPTGSGIPLDNPKVTLSRKLELLTPGSAASGAATAALNPMEYLKAIVDECEKLSPAGRKPDYSAIIAYIEENMLNPAIFQDATWLNQPGTEVSTPGSLLSPGIVNYKELSSISTYLNKISYLYINSLAESGQKEIDGTKAATLLSIIATTDTVHAASLPGSDSLRRSRAIPGLKRRLITHNAQAFLRNFLPKINRSSLFATANPKANEARLHLQKHFEALEKEIFSPTENCLTEGNWNSWEGNTQVLNLTKAILGSYGRSNTFSLAYFSQMPALKSDFIAYYLANPDIPRLGSLGDISSSNSPDASYFAYLLYTPKVTAQYLKHLQDTGKTTLAAALKEALQIVKTQQQLFYNSHIAMETFNQGIRSVATTEFGTPAHKDALSQSAVGAAPLASTDANLAMPFLARVSPDGITTTSYRGSGTGIHCGDTMLMLQIRSDHKRYELSPEVAGVSVYDRACTGSAALAAVARATLVDSGVDSKIPDSIISRYKSSFPDTSTMALARSSWLVSAPPVTNFMDFARHFHNPSKRMIDIIRQMGAINSETAIARDAEFTRISTGLQITSTVDLFQRNIDLLGDSITDPNELKLWQTFCIGNILQPGVLVEQLDLHYKTPYIYTNNPLEKIRNFTSRGINLYSPGHDASINTLFFLYLKLSAHMATRSKLKELRRAGTITAEQKNILYNSLTEEIDTLLTQTTDKQILSNLHAFRKVLILSQIEDTPALRDVAANSELYEKLLFSSLYSTSIALAEPHEEFPLIDFNPVVEREVFSRVAATAPALCTRVINSLRDDVPKLHQLHTDMSASTWTQHETLASDSEEQTLVKQSHFDCTDGTGRLLARICIHTGKIITAGGIATAPMPKIIYNSRLYQNAFSFRPDSCDLHDGGKQAIFRDSFGNQCYYRINEAGEDVVQRDLSINGANHRYQLCSLKEPKPGMPTEVVGTNFPKILTQANLQAWLKTTVAGESKELVLFDKETGKAKYRFDYASNKVHLLNEDGTDSNYVLVASSNDLYESFSHFEDKELTLIWKYEGPAAGDKPFGDVLMQMPRYDIEFQGDKKAGVVPEEIEFSLASDRGFKLDTQAPDPAHPKGILGFQHSLVIKHETRDGKIHRQLLVPRKQFFLLDGEADEHTAKVSGIYHPSQYDTSDTATVRRIAEIRGISVADVLKLYPPKYDGKETVFRYTLTDDGHGNLTQVKANTPEEWLHLAYIHASQGNFVEAMKAVRNINDLKGTVKEAESIKQICEELFYKTSVDGEELKLWTESVRFTPEFGALKLHVASLAASFLASGREFNIESSVETNPLDTNYHSSRFRAQGLSGFFDKDNFTEKLMYIVNDYGFAENRLAIGARLSEREVLPALDWMHDNSDAPELFQELYAKVNSKSLARELRLLSNVPAAQKSTFVSERLRELRADRLSLAGSELKVRQTERAVVSERESEMLVDIKVGSFSSDLIMNVYDDESPARPGTPASTASYIEGLTFDFSNLDKAFHKIYYSIVTSPAGSLTPAISKLKILLEEKMRMIARKESIMQGVKETGFSSEEQLNDELCKLLLIIINNKSAFTANEFLLSRQPRPDGAAYRKQPKIQEASTLLNKLMVKANALGPIKTTVTVSGSVTAEKPAAKTPEALLGTEHAISTEEVIDLFKESDVPDATLLEDQLFADIEAGDSAPILKILASTLATFEKEKIATRVARKISTAGGSGGTSVSYEDMMQAIIQKEKIEGQRQHEEETELRERVLAGLFNSKSLFKSDAAAEELKREEVNTKLRAALDKTRAKAAAVNTEITAKEREIYALANKTASAGKTAEEIAHEIAGSREMLSIEQLIYIASFGDPKVFVRFNPNLSEAECTELYSKVCSYMKYTQVAQKYERTCAQMSTVISAVNRAKPSTSFTEDKAVCSEVYNLATTLFAPDPVQILIEKVEADIAAGKDVKNAAVVLPTLSAFHVANNLVIRPDQLEFLIDMKNAHATRPGTYTEAVYQMIMGFGKSKVLAPNNVLWKILGNKGKLSVIEVPDSLFDTFAKDIDITTRKLFGKRAIRVKFKRENARTSEDFKKIYLALQRAMSNGDYIVTDDTSIPSLELMWLSAALEKPSGDPTDSEVIDWNKSMQYLQLINNLMTEHAECMRDECDTMMDPLRKLIFVVDKGTPISGKRATYNAEFMLFLNHVDISDIADVGITANFADIIRNQHPSKSDTVDLLDSEDKWSQAMARIADGLLDKDNPNNPLPISTICPPCDPAALKAYLLGSPDKPEHFEALATELQDQLSHYSKQLSGMLKFTLKDKDPLLVGYGPIDPDSRNPRKRFGTVPYKGARTPDTSVWGNPDVACNFACQTLICLGLEHQDIVSVLKGLQAQAAMELSENDELEFDETVAGISFKDMFSDTKDAAKAQLARLSSGAGAAASDADLITPELIRGIEVAGVQITVPQAVEYISNFSLERADTLNPIFEIVSRLLTGSEMFQNFLLTSPRGVLNSIDEMSDTLESTFANHMSCYRTGQYVSGDPYNASAAPARIARRHEDLSFGTTGRILSYLEGTHVSPTSKVDPKELLAEQMETLARAGKDTKSVRALIDAHARFKAFENEEVAQKIAEYYREHAAEYTEMRYVIYLKKVKGVAGGDDSLVLHALNIANGEEIYLGSSDPKVIMRKLNCSIEEYFVYYPHFGGTRGLDVKLPSEATAIMTVDADNKLFEIEQAAFRMRGLKTGAHHLSFAVDAQLQERMVREGKDPSDVKSVIDVAHTNQSDLLSEVNIRGAMASIQDVGRRHAIELMRQFKKPEVQSAIANAFRKTFITEIKDKLRELYSAVPVEQRTEDILQIFKNRVMSSFDSAVGELQASEFADLKVDKVTESGAASAQTLHEALATARAAILVEIDEEIAEYKKCCAETYTIAPEDSASAEVTVQHEVEAETEIDAQLQQEDPLAKPEKAVRWLQSGSTVTGGVVNINGYDDPENVITLESLMRCHSDRGWTFSSQLKVTNDFGFTTTRQKAGRADPIDIYVKPVNYLMFRKTGGAPPLECIILSPWDVEDLENKIKKSASATQINSNFWIQTTSETPVLGVKPSKEELASPLYQNYDSLLEQARYFGGQFDLLAKSPSPWLSQSAKEKIQFASEKILPKHRVNQRDLTAIQMRLTSLSKVFSKISDANTSELDLMTTAAYWRGKDVSDEAIPDLIRVAQLFKRILGTTALTDPLLDEATATAGYPLEAHGIISSFIRRQKATLAISSHLQKATFDFSQFSTAITTITNRGTRNKILNSTKFNSTATNTTYPNIIMYAIEELHDTPQFAELFTFLLANGADTTKAYNEDGDNCISFFMKRHPDKVGLIINHITSMPNILDIYAVLSNIQADTRTSIMNGLNIEGISKVLDKSFVSLGTGGSLNVPDEIRLGFINVLGKYVTMLSQKLGDVITSDSISSATPGNDLFILKNIIEGAIRSWDEQVIQALLTIVPEVSTMDFAIDGAASPQNLATIAVKKDSDVIYSILPVIAHQQPNRDGTTAEKTLEEKDAESRAAFAASVARANKFRSDIAAGNSDAIIVTLTEHPYLASTIDSVERGGGAAVAGEDPFFIGTMVFDNHSVFESIWASNPAAIHSSSRDGDMYINQRLQDAAGTSIDSTTKEMIAYSGGVLSGERGAIRVGLARNTGLSTNGIKAAIETCLPIAASVSSTPQLREDILVLHSELKTRRDLKGILPPKVILSILDNFDLISNVDLTGWAISELATDTERLDETRAKVIERVNQRILSSSSPIHVESEASRAICGALQAQLHIISASSDLGASKEAIRIYLETFAKDLKVDSDDPHLEVKIVERNDLIERFYKRSILNGDIVGMRMIMERVHACGNQEIKDHFKEVHKATCKNELDALLYPHVGAGKTHLPDEIKAILKLHYKRGFELGLTSGNECALPLKLFEHFRTNWDHQIFDRESYDYILASCQTRDHHGVPITDRACSNFEAKNLMEIAVISGFDRAKAHPDEGDHRLLLVGLQNNSEELDLNAMFGSVDLSLASTIFKKAVSTATIIPSEQVIEPLLKFISPFDEIGRNLTGYLNANLYNDDEGGIVNNISETVFSCLYDLVSQEDFVFSDIQTEEALKIIRFVMPRVIKELSDVYIRSADATVQNEYSKLYVILMSTLELIKDRRRETEDAAAAAGGVDIENVDRIYNTLTTAIAPMLFAIPDAGKAREDAFRFLSSPDATMDLDLLSYDLICAYERPPTYGVLDTDSTKKVDVQSIVRTPHVTEAASGDLAFKIAHKSPNSAVLSKIILELIKANRWDDVRKLTQGAGALLPFSDNWIYESAADAQPVSLFTHLSRTDPRLALDFLAETNVIVGANSVSSSTLTGGGITHGPRNKLILKNALGANEFELVKASRELVKQSLRVIAPNLQAAEAAGRLDDEMHRFITALINLGSISEGMIINEFGGDVWPAGLPLEVLEGGTAPISTLEHLITFARGGYAPTSPGIRERFTGLVTAYFTQLCDPEIIVYSDPEYDDSQIADKNIDRTLNNLDQLLNQLDKINAADHPDLINVIYRNIAIIMHYFDHKLTIEPGTLATPEVEMLTNSYLNATSSALSKISKHPEAVNYLLANRVRVTRGRDFNLKQLLRKPIEYTTGPRAGATADAAAGDGSSDVIVLNDDSNRFDKVLLASMAETELPEGSPLVTTASRSVQLILDMEREEKHKLRFFGEPVIEDVLSAPISEPALTLLQGTPYKDLLPSRMDSIALAVSEIYKITNNTASMAPFLVREQILRTERCWSTILPNLVRVPDADSTILSTMQRCKAFSTPRVSTPDDLEQRKAAASICAEAAKEPGKHDLACATVMHLCGNYRIDSGTEGQLPYNEQLKSILNSLSSRSDFDRLQNLFLANFRWDIEKYILLSGDQDLIWSAINLLGPQHFAGMMGVGAKSKLEQIAESQYELNPTRVLDMFSSVANSFSNCIRADALTASHDSKARMIASIRGFASSIVLLNRSRTVDPERTRVVVLAALELLNNASDKLDLLPEQSQADLVNIFKEIIKLNINSTDGKYIESFAEVSAKLARGRFINSLFFNIFGKDEALGALESRGLSKEELIPYFLPTLRAILEMRKEAFSYDAAITDLDVILSICKGHKFQGESIIDIFNNDEYAAALGGANFSLSIVRKISSLPPEIDLHAGGERLTSILKSQFGFLYAKYSDEPELMRKLLNDREINIIEALGGSFPTAPDSTFAHNAFERFPVHLAESFQDVDVRHTNPISIIKVLGAASNRTCVHATHHRCRAMLLKAILAPERLETFKKLISYPESGAINLEMPIAMYFEALDEDGNTVINGIKDLYNGSADGTPEKNAALRMLNTLLLKALQSGMAEEVANIIGGTDIATNINNQPCLVATTTGIGAAATKGCLFVGHDTTFSSVGRNSTILHLICKADSGISDENTARILANERLTVTRELSAIGDPHTHPFALLMAAGKKGSADVYLNRVPDAASDRLTDDLDTIFRVIGDTTFIYSDELIGRWKTLIKETFSSDSHRKLRELAINSPELTEKMVLLMARGVSITAMPDEDFQLVINLLSNDPRTASIVARTPSVAGGIVERLCRSDATAANNEVLSRFIMANSNLLETAGINALPPEATFESFNNTTVLTALAHRVANAPAAMNHVLHPAIFRNLIAFSRTDAFTGSLSAAQQVEMLRNLKAKSKDLPREMDQLIMQERVDARIEELLGGPDASVEQQAASNSRPRMG